MTRLLVLCEFPTPGGGDRSFWAAAPHLEAAGFQLAFAAPPAGPLADEIARRGWPLWLWCPKPSGPERLPLEALRSDLTDLIARAQPHFVVANSLSTGRVSGPVCRGLGLPSVAHLRDIVGISRQAMADLNQHRRLLAVSEATRKHHVGQGADPARTFVAVNGVRLDEFSPGPRSGTLHRELGLPSGAMLGATIGQIILRKGWDVLLGALDRVLPARPELHWLLVGQRHSEKPETREHQAALRQHCEAAPWRAQVHWLEQRDDMPRLLAELQLTVHPARQEPLGRVLLEAAAVAVPVVATEVGGTPEIFGHPPAALLVPPGDAAALADAIEQVLADPAAAARRAELARRRIEDHFDVRHTTRGWIDHYQAALASD